MSLFSLGFILGGIVKEYSSDNKVDDYDYIVNELILSDTSQIDLQIKSWHYFIDAIIDVESKGNEKAIGKTNDVGVLQITPIYVEEANRILGEKKYTLEDRYCKYKSIEIFTIVNAKHNPEKSFLKAIKLHNPNAPKSYQKAIIDRYVKLMLNDKD